MKEMDRKLREMISPLRKKRDTKAFLKFNKWVLKKYKPICYAANTRWIISIADTYVDYSACTGERFAAHQLVTLVAFEKLRRTLPLDRTVQPVGAKLWDGVRTYSMGPGADMVKNYIRRLQKNMRAYPHIWWMTQTVLMRMALEPDSIFTHIDQWAVKSTRQQVLDAVRERYCGGYVKIHKERKYGTTGRKWKETVCSLVPETYSLIDYGCGQSNIKWPHKRVQYYDPAIQKFQTLPVKSNWLVNLDVLEHISIGDLPTNLRFMSSLAPNAIFNIATRKARTLVDGENAHRTVKPTSWWVTELKEYYNDVLVHSDKEGHSCLLIAKTS